MDIIVKHKKYIITLMTILSLVVFILLVSFYSSISIIKQQINVIGQNSVQSAATNSENIINTAKFVLDMAAVSIENFGSHKTEDIKKYIDSFSEYIKTDTNTEFSNIYAYVNGEFINTDDYNSSDLSEYLWYKTAVKSDKTIFTEDNGKMTVARKVHDYGIIAVDIDMDIISEFMNSVIMEEASWFIIDNESKIVLSNSNTDASEAEFDREYMMNHSHGDEKEGIAVYNYYDIKKYEFYKKINDTWYLTIVISGNELYKESYILLQRQAIFSVIFCIIIVILYTKSYVSNMKAEENSEIKSNFLANMSHEIRTPMNAIIGMTEIAKNSADSPEKVMSCIAKIERSTKFLKMLIDDILDISRIESGKLILVNQNFNLDETLNGIDDVFRPLFEKRKIDFIIERDYVNSEFTGDELRLKQVMINLISNALKFTENGSVKLSIISENVSDFYEEIKFSVKDTGIGIKKDNIDKIFKPFEQAEQHITSNFGGTGLGLAITSNLLKMMSSKIEVTSEENKGSEFFFSINMKVTDKKDKIGGKMLNFEKIDFTGQKVLLAEDNPLNAEIAQELLGRAGFDTDIASNGREAVNMFENSPIGYYSVILMDVRMPEMNGLEATKEIRNLNRKDASQVIIIAMTANAFSEDKQKATEAGMNEYLTKPVNIKVFYDTLARVVGENNIIIGECIKNE